MKRDQQQHGGTQNNRKSGLSSNPSNEVQDRQKRVNQMHVRTGSSKLSQKNGTSRSPAYNETKEPAGGAEIQGLKKQHGNNNLQPTRKNLVKEMPIDVRGQVTQLQSQEKKAGDRQSVPNIDETITVQLSVAEPATVIEDKSNSSIIVLTDGDQPRHLAEKLADTNKTQRRDGGFVDASKEVRHLLEFLFLDVKVRSPAEIQELTDAKLVQERIDLGQVPTMQLIKDIRSSIEVLLSIKNDNSNTNGGRMDTLMMQDDSMADRASFSEHQFNTHKSPQSTNPFENANRKSLLRGVTGEGGKEGPDGTAKDRNGYSSIKSQSLFSNYLSGKKKGNLAQERALTEFDSAIGYSRPESALSDATMNTQQNCVALEIQLQKYEGDIRKHISIEHQLQLFAEDLKKQVSQLEKEKDLIEKETSTSIEELKKDKMTLREFLDIKEKTLDENVIKIKQFEKQATEQKVQIAQLKLKYDKQLSEMRNQVNLLETTTRHESKHSLSNEKSSMGHHAHQSSSSALGRHQKTQLIGNRNSGGHIMISNSQQRTPIGAQLSTGITTGSQKHHAMNSQPGGSRATAAEGGHAKSNNLMAKESQQSNLASSQQIGIKRQQIGGSQASQSNQNVISKVRKTPSEFQLTSFLVVQNNLTQAINGGDSQAPKSRQSVKHNQTMGISPIKSSRKIASNAVTTNSIQLQNSTIQHANHMNGKHSRSSAQLDVNKISLTARMVPTESPIVKRAAAAAQAAGGPHEHTAPFELYKKALPRKQQTQLKSGVGTNPGSIASSSLADHTQMTMTQAKPKDLSQSPVLPSSAPDTETNQKYQLENKTSEFDQSKNAGTQPQPNRHQQLTNTGGNNSGVQKGGQAVHKQSFTVGTHRRSNTAIAFVPQMTLKQFQDQKNAALASNQMPRKQMNKNQVNSFDLRSLTGTLDKALDVSSGRNTVIDRQSHQPPLQQQQTGSKVTSIKKLDVIRRDKSQPEVLFRGDKRQMLSNTGTGVQSTQQMITAASGANKQHHSSQSKNAGLSNSVLISGSSGGGNKHGKSQGRLSNSMINGSNTGTGANRKPQQNHSIPQYLVQNSQQQQQRLKQGQTSQVMEGGQQMTQNLSKNIAQKQQKLLRNQIFKSTDFSKGGQQQQLQSSQQQLQSANHGGQI